MLRGLLVFFLTQSALATGLPTGIPADLFPAWATGKDTTQHKHLQITNCFVQKDMPIKAENLLKKEVSPQEAEELFRYLKNQPDIPFCYPEDGCHSRAHAMAKLLEDKGIFSEKIFVISPLSANKSVLEINHPFQQGKKINWWFHVASTVWVTHPSGAREQMVIDPSLTSTPVSVKKWLSLQTDSRCIKITAVNWRQIKQCMYFTTNRGIYHPTDIKSDSKNVWKKYDFTLTEYTFRRFGEISKRRKILQIISDVIQWGKF